MPPTAAPATRNIGRYLPSDTHSEIGGDFSVQTVLHHVGLDGCVAQRNFTKPHMPDSRSQAVLPLIVERGRQRRRTLVVACKRLPATGATPSFRASTGSITNRPASPFRKCRQALCLAGDSEKVGDKGCPLGSLQREQFGHGTTRRRNRPCKRRSGAGRRPAGA